MGFQTNIILSQSAADWLDTQALAIRKRQGVHISRSGFLRALAHGAEDGGLDFSHCRSERDIAGYLSIVIRAFLNRDFNLKLPAYTNEPLGTKRVVYTDQNAPAQKGKQPHEAPGSLE